MNFENEQKQDLERVPFTYVELTGRPERDRPINNEDICNLKIALSKGIGPEGINI